MLTANADISDFINKFVIPSKEPRINSDCSWALRDHNHNFLLCSHQYAQMFTDNKHPEQLKGKSIHDLSLPTEVIEKIKFRDKQFLHLNDKKPSHCVESFNLQGKMYIAMTTRTPIVYKNNTIAIEVTSIPLRNEYIDLERHLNKRKSSNKFNKNEIISPIELSPRDELVLQLLILRRTQHEIAHMLNLSRSRIAQVIEDMANKFGIKNGSGKALVQKAIHLGYNDHIPLELLALVIA